MAEACEPEPEYEVVDGWRVSLRDGEVLGLDQPTSTFGVTDRDSADWVLGKIADVEARALAIQARKQAVAENFARQEKQLAGRLAWLERRFGPELEAWAKAQIEGKRSRFVQLDNGRVQFRVATSPAKITDPAAALAFVRDAGFKHRIRTTVTESVDAAAVVDAIAAVAFARGATPDTAAFLKPAAKTDRMSIETLPKSTRS